MNTRADWIRAVLAVVAILAVTAPVAAAGKDHRDGRQGENNPLVIGHRGASGYLPEHTLESYALAIRLGADYVEPDLVATKDGHLIARHEPNITNTTDVASDPEFADRKTTKKVDGFDETGWFASDFTLKEIKTLGALQTFPERPQQFNGRFKIPTLGEVIELVQRESKRRHRRIGIYPETKHPTYHQALNLPLEGRLVRILDRYDLDKRKSPVFIQSFEQSNLMRLNRMTPVRLVQLVDAFDVDANGVLIYEPPFDRPYDWTVSGDPELLSRTFGFFATDEGLEEISTYADGIGPWKKYIVSTNANNDTLPPTDLIDRAHEHGLLIHTWTFRSEQSRLANQYNGNPINEYLQFYELGIDGVFSDFPDDAFVARELFWEDWFRED
ncbi:MAG: glycerophosphodiester phosphodiesterase [Thermoleophilaceae bacterium]